MGRHSTGAAVPATIAAMWDACPALSERSLGDEEAVDAAMREHVAFRAERFQETELRLGRRR